MNWVIKSFDALTPLELYRILKVRIDVFMLEQNCLYPECDNKDLKSEHLFLMNEAECLAYARLLPPNLSYPNCSSIGRVVASICHGAVMVSGVEPRTTNDWYVSNKHLDFCTIDRTDVPVVRLRSR